MCSSLILLAAAIGLALLCVAVHPRTLRAIWPAAAYLIGALLGVSDVAVVIVTLAAAILTWPVRQAWTVRQVRI